VHKPQGAIPKDGGSGGIAIVSSLISLALDTPIEPGFAMTGEITLKGKVTKIGGVKEKVMGGKHSNMRNFIFSKENQEDVEVLDEEIKDDCTFYFVEEYKEIFPILFPQKRDI
jgi:ATP-dependent Lon protease